MEGDEANDSLRVGKREWGWAMGGMERRKGENQNKTKTKEKKGRLQADMQNTRVQHKALYKTIIMFPGRAGSNGSI
jgi:hypothetical protein